MRVNTTSERNLKKKKKKTSVVKKPIFRMQIRYFRALGSNSVSPSGHRRGLCRLSPFVEVTSRCGYCLAHGRALRKAAFPRGSSTPFHVFCNPTPSTEDVIKKQTKKKIKKKKKKEEKNTKKKNT